MTIDQVENKKRNRYPDKLPYDHNRVLLNALINGSNSDYINASTVVISQHNRVDILTQLNLPFQFNIVYTCFDFVAALKFSQLLQ
jgi:protein tyrosine phosphatase